MPSSTSTILATAAAMASSVLAKTDLSGCTTTDMSSPAGASVAWYVPGTGELCDMLDCGGGRAPPKTNVPGCPSYSGTASYSPSYLPGYQAEATGAPSTTAAAGVTASPSTTVSSSFSTSISGFPDISGLDTSESSWDLYTTNAALPPGTASSAEVSALTTAASNPTQLPTVTGYNGTSYTSGPIAGGSGNDTLTNGTRPSSGSGGSSGSGSGSGSSTTTSAAAGATAQVCGLVLGLGALVAAL